MIHQPELQALSVNKQKRLPQNRRQPPCFYKSFAYNKKDNLLLHQFFDDALLPIGHLYVIHTGGQVFHIYISRIVHQCL